MLLHKPHNFPLPSPYHPSIFPDPRSLAGSAFEKMTTYSDVAHFGASTPTGVTSSFNASMNATSADAQPLFIATLNPVTLFYHLLTHPKIKVSIDDCVWSL